MPQNKMAPTVSNRKLQELKNGETVVIYILNPPSPRVELYPIPLKLVKHFATLMTAEVSPLNRKCINLTDVSKDFVKFYIQWMYAGGTFCTSPKPVKLAETNVGQVLQLYFFCDKSGIAPLKQHATDLLERNIAVKPFLLEDFDAVYKGTSIFDGLRLVVAAGSKKWAKLEMVKKWYTPQIFQAECTNTYRAGVEALSALWNEIESEQLQKAWEVAERGERKNAQGWAQMRAGKGAEHNGGPSKMKYNNRRHMKPKQAGSKYGIVKGQKSIDGKTEVDTTNA